MSATAQMRIDESEKVIEDLLNRIRSLVVPEHRNDFDSQIAMVRLRLVIKSIDTLCKEISSYLEDGTEGFIQEWRDLRKGVEQAKRELQLQEPSSSEEFESALMWLYERGESHHLPLIQHIMESPPFASPLISKVFEILSQKSYNKRWQEAKKVSYRVFCSEGEVESLPAGAEIVEEYGAFVIITAGDDVIAELRKRFPVERLESTAGPRAGSGLVSGDHPGSTASEDTSGEIVMAEMIVSFKGPVRDAWKKRLEDVGAKVLAPLDGYKFVISIPDKVTLFRVRGLDEVERIEPYRPEIHVWSESLDRLMQRQDPDESVEGRADNDMHKAGSQEHAGLPLPGVFVASFFTPESCDRAVERLSSIGIEILDRPDDAQLVFDVGPAEDLIKHFNALISLDGLRALEEESIPIISDYKAREVIGNGVAYPVNDGPWTGRGEIIAIADTGLDTGLIDLMHPDFAGRVREITSFRMDSSLSRWVDNPEDDDGPIDKYSGHGTHVAGSALGNGEMAKRLTPDPIQGMAPEAELVFQAVEQSPRWNKRAISRFKDKGLIPPSHGLFGIPAYLPMLFNHAYEKGARIHSNSWNDFTHGPIYGRYSTYLDQFVWTHKDFLVLVSAGNGGKVCTDDPTMIEQMSIHPPATAKNCLTVGATENKRNGEFCETYGGRWPGRFGYGPFIEDCLVDYIDDIAAFSSRGPCRDGRIKPDLVAPGTFILSTRSRQIPDNNFASSPFPDAELYYMYMSGTSMATPLVAGSAALCRQFLRERQGFDNPSAALLKATIIHSAEYFEYRHRHSSSRPWADFEQGWGRINLKNILDPSGATKLIYVDETAGLSSGERVEYDVEVNDNKPLLRVTLAYTDYPGPVLVNNLNLQVEGPEKQKYCGNDFDGSLKMDACNNVEAVIIESPPVGRWTIKVIASNVKQGRQDFALVISGGELKEIARRRLPAKG